MLRTLWALALGFLLLAGCGAEDTVAGAAKGRSPRLGLAQPIGGDVDVADLHIWISQDGDVNAASSWSTGQAPAAWTADDAVLVDGVASQVSMTSGLTSPQGIDITRFDVTEGFAGDIGLPGTPIRFASGGVVTMRGSGALHYYAVTDADVFVDSPNHLNAVTMYFFIKTLYVKQGHVDVAAAAAFIVSSGHLVTFGPYATVTVAGSANTGPMHVRMYDGTVDLGLRGAGVANSTIDVAGGLLKLHKLTGVANYLELRQTGGMIDFDMAAANGGTVRMQLAGGIADFRKSRYAFGSFTYGSYITPGSQIIPGPVTTEAVLQASGIRDFRKEYP